MKQSQRKGCCSTKSEDKHTGEYSSEAMMQADDRPSAEEDTSKGFIA